jgi:hypothetical protein
VQYSVVFIIVCLLAVLNYEGLVFDLIGVGLEAVEPDFNTTVADNTAVDIMIGGENISKFLNKELEVPYDWGTGRFVYITFLSAIFMGTIVLEGVDTSLMVRFIGTNFYNVFVCIHSRILSLKSIIYFFQAKVTPPALNDAFINSGFLATLVGTLGRVVGDTIITLSAFLDKDIFTDFVNATFAPMVPLAVIGLFFAFRYYHLLM